MAKYTKENVDAAISSAMETVGLRSLKKEQKEVIHAFVGGKDVFVALPTGYGQFFFYALLPLIFDNLRSCESTSIVICISPLRARMMEQRDKFSMNGISSQFVGELQQDIDAIKGVQSGSFQLVFISPESILRNPQWREMLLSKPYRENLVGFVVDEAHCVTKW